MNSVTAERDVKLLRVQPETSPTVEPGLSVSLRIWGGEKKTPQNQVSSLKRERWQIAPRRKKPLEQNVKEKSAFNGAWRAIQECSPHDDSTVAFMSVSSSLSWSLGDAYPQNGGVGVVSGWKAWSNPTRRSLTCSQMRHLCGAVNNWQFSLICSSLTTPHFSHSAYEIWGGKNPTTSAFLFTVHQSCFPCLSLPFPFILRGKFPQTRWTRTRTWK